MSWLKRLFEDNKTFFTAAVGNNIEEGVDEAKKGVSTEITNREVDVTTEEERAKASEQMLNLLEPNERTANYTAVLSDEGKAIDGNKPSGGPLKVTIPPGIFPVGAWFSVRQVGKEPVEVVQGTGVSLRSAAGFSTKAQWSVMMVAKRATPDEFIVSQEVTAEIAVPANVSLPLISGVLNEGETLTTTVGTWTEGPESFTYQWKRCNESGGEEASIGGATASTYKLTATDVGKTIRVAVVAKNAKGTSSAAISEHTGLVSKVSELTTFTPSIIAVGAVEIPNSGRGLYDWQGGTSGLPAAWPMRDYYLRDSLEWKRDLETSKEVYPFVAKPTEGPIAEAMKKAEEKGGRVRFRIMSSNPPASKRYPAYIETEVFVQSGTTYEFPKWNSTSFLTAWKNLWKALGETYGSNPRIGWIDVGGYGWSGEQSMSPVLGTETTTHITLANFEAMVDACVKAFPKAHVLISPSAPYKNESPYQQGLIPGVIKNFPTVGFIYDNLGVTQPVHGNNLPNMAPGGAAPNEEVWKRWQTAPVISEWWNNTEAKVPQARIEINGGSSKEAFHTSAVGSGNIQSSVRTGAEAEYALLLKESGFRYALHSVKIPSTITREKAFTIESTWENVNSIPTYDAWKPEWQLRVGSEVRWHGAATAITLKKLWAPQGEVTYIDTITIKTGELTAGTYTLAVVIKDENAILSPMNIAIEGQEPDGSYKLGSVVVA